MHRADQVIKGAVDLLSTNAGLGKPVADLSDYLDILYPSAPPGAMSSTSSPLRHGKEGGVGERRIRGIPGGETRPNPPSL